jgi:hypothetical protein
MSSELYVDKVLKWREQTTEEATNKDRVVPYWKSISTAQRNAAPTHCGPHGSYPLGPGCAHVVSARHLAKTGHGDNPSGILSCVNSYASRHGCGSSE